MSKHIRKVLGLLQHRKQIPPPHQQPTSRTPEEWSTYWKAQGQPWRTEPEIDKERREYLAKRRIIPPDVKHGIYLFKGIRLSRADVEWLLATLDGRGPVDWSDEQDREREGLDLRGADLRSLDLSGLPLACLRGGLSFWEYIYVSSEQAREAAVLMNEADLHRAQLQGAHLYMAQLQGAHLGYAQLQGARLTEAQLQGAHLGHAQLQGAHFHEAQLQEAYLASAQLQGASFHEAQLQGANLHWAQLQRAFLDRAQLQGANLAEAHLEGADVSLAHLEGAQLDGVFFDTATQLNDAVLGNKSFGSVSLADIHWNDVNLAVVDWSNVTILGNERLAHLQIEEDGTTKDKHARLRDYHTAVRANRQLAVALQVQGLNEEAARFVYRGQVLQKSILRFQMTQQGVTLRQRIQTFGAWLFSWSLFLLAGYGYRVWRSFATYILVIGGFATAYYLLGPRVGLPLTCVDAIVFSMTSFHGRGFSPGENIGLSNPLTILAAMEAFVGLVIEITLIATLTQRFFGK